MYENGLDEQFNDSVYRLRRNNLIAAIKRHYPHCTRGTVVLFAGFESDRVSFRQESFFYYFTGLREPGLACMLDFSGEQTLYIPTYKRSREQWVVAINFDQNGAQRVGFDALKEWGEPVEGYQVRLPLQKSYCKNIIDTFDAVIRDAGLIFTPLSNDSSDGIHQRMLFQQLKEWIPSLAHALVDAADCAAALRRRKDMYEIGAITAAIELTNLAHQAAVKAIVPGNSEAEVRGAIEYIFTIASSRPAFPSIVAAGSHGTILHYTDGDGTMQKDDLVVVDIGAEFDCYAADITRTYPVSGQFSKRQKSLYDVVLDTQGYIAEKARPGMWLSNKENQERSLNHLARAYLEKYGYGDYFPHGIGHFLGLDVHDVGNGAEPLQEGDVITIEPGIYIPHEGIGIRIEDDYMITPGGSMCLSDELPKKTEELCSWMATVRIE